MISRASIRADLAPQNLTHSASGSSGTTMSDDRRKTVILLDEGLVPVGGGLDLAPGLCGEFGREELAFVVVCQARLRAKAVQLDERCTGTPGELLDERGLAHTAASATGYERRRPLGPQLVELGDEILSAVEFFSAFHLAPPLAYSATCRLGEFSVDIISPTRATVNTLSDIRFNLFTPLLTTNY